VTSPTFTLVHEYRGRSANLYHIDLYRVDTPRELETLGWTICGPSAVFCSSSGVRNFRGCNGAGCGNFFGAGWGEWAADYDPELACRLACDGRNRSGPRTSGRGAPLTYIENKMAAAKRVKVRRFARITSLSQFVP